MMAGLQREVRDHEPWLRFLRVPDGLTIIRRLLCEAPAFLKDDGHLIMEIGFDQGEAVKDLVDRRCLAICSKFGPIFKAFRESLSCRRS